MTAPMANCPTCGAVLAASLVASILDPQQPECCPKKGRRR